jgi:tetratricopeptide (TPR) repeat protein
MAGGGGEHAMARSVYYLNQWLNGGRNVEGPWEPDRMVASIPRALKDTPGLERLDDLEFAPQDLGHLQQTLWLYDIANRVRMEKPPAALAPWLKEIEAQGKLPESEQLAAAERLFDWTVRNLQLDPLPPPPKGPAATAGEGTDPVSPASLGQLGPGYGHMPIQLLVMGHGDAHERARLFILLCRQAGVHVVMLGRIDETVSSTPQPWMVAAFIGQELYLFEPSLGLPVPGPDGKGIATLSQVLADPAVLRQLDVPGGPAYPLASTDLKTIVALIEAEPESFARRFALLQAALPSSRRLILAVQPTQIEPQLRKCKGISGVSLWRVPYEAVLFQMGRQNVIAASPQLQLEFDREERIFTQPDTPLMLGRNLHLQGKFESDERLPGARTYYLQARLPDEVRDKLYESAEFRHRIGFNQPLPEDDKQKEVVLETMVTLMRRAKEHATYWLGLTYFDQGNYEASIEWLEKRTLQAPLPSPWIPGARYNLGRAYEALGQYDRAIAMYRADDSPQRHGNLLRALRLEGQQ